jgi:hypothetical protein
MKTVMIFSVKYLMPVYYALAKAPGTQGLEYINTYLTVFA